MFVIKESEHVFVLIFHLLTSLFETVNLNVFLDDLISGITQLPFQPNDLIISLEIPMLRVFELQNNFLIPLILLSQLIFREPEFSLNLIQHPLVLIIFRILNSDFISLVLRIFLYRSNLML